MIIDDVFFDNLFGCTKSESFEEERKEWPGHFDEQGRRLCDLWRLGCDASSTQDEYGGQPLVVLFWPDSNWRAHFGGHDVFFLCEYHARRLHQSAQELREDVEWIDRNIPRSHAMINAFGRELDGAR